MKLKMAMLEQAHGLLCNAPGAGGSEHDAELWRRKRAEWIDQWGHLIRAQEAKEHNRRVAIGNEAITDYQDREQAAARDVRELGAIIEDAAAGWDRITLYRDAIGVQRWPNGQPVLPDIPLVREDDGTVTAPGELYFPSGDPSGEKRRAALARMNATRED